MTKSRARPSVRRNPNDLAGLRVGLYCRVSKEDDGDEKSTTDQAAAGREWTERVGAQIVESYVEEGGRSASRFATKEREQFNRLLADVEAGRLDIVWVWAIDRSNRNLRVFADLRDLFQKRGVWLSVNGRMHDPDNYDDWMLLGFTSIFAERYSEELSKNVCRGRASVANAGRPGGFSIFGYRRVYDENTRRFAREDADIAIGEDGQPDENSPGLVVGDIFQRVAAGVPLTTIARDLNARGVTTPRGAEWKPTAVRRVAINPAYIRRLVHQGRILEGVVAVWPALTDEETFWTCQRILKDESRKTTDRPGRAQHLLSYIIRCGKCGAKVQRHKANDGIGEYACTNGAHAVIRMPILDRYVERVIIRWLADPAVYAMLTEIDDSRAASRARAELEELRVDLADWRRKAKAGQVSAAFYADIEQDRLRKIAEVEQRVHEATLPPVLVGVMGPEAKARWAKLDIAVKRQIVAAVADIRILPVGRGQSPYVEMPDRVQWTWLLGPGVEEVQE